MRKISATYVYPLSAPPVDYGIILLEQGIIHGLDTMGHKPKESSSLEYYNGILTPGFINLNFQAGTLRNRSLLQNRIHYQKGIRAEITYRYAEPGEENICELSVHEVLNKTTSGNEYKLKIPIPLIAEGSMLFPDEKEPLTGIEWIIISPDTISLNDRKSLASFFKNNLDKILFSWNPLNEMELCSMMNYFLQSGSAIHIQDVLRPLTLNAAKMIGQNGFMGELKPGISPGINLISGIDFKKMIFRERDFQLIRIS